VKVSQTRVTAAGTVQYQMKCKDCGKFYSISARAYQDYREAKG